MSFITSTFTAPFSEIVNPNMQVWALLLYFIFYFSIGHAWRSWANFRATGINPLVLPRDDSSLGYIGRAFKVVMVSIFVYAVLAAFQWLPALPSMWQTPVWLGVVAWITLLTSLVWLLIAQSQMGESWRIGIDEIHATNLVTHGLFGYSRNPIFLSMRCSMFAFTALTPTAPVLVLMVASELLMQIQVRMEEAHLAKQHSQDYLHYSQRVKRWL